MGLFRRQFTKEFLAAVSRSPSGAGVGGEPQRAHTAGAGVPAGAGNAFSGNGKQRWSEGRIAELERKIGQQALEIDFLKGCLQRIEEQRMLRALTGNPPYRKVQEEVKAKPGLTIERMVKLGRVSRSGYYCEQLWRNLSKVHITSAERGVGTDRVSGWVLAGGVRVLGSGTWKHSRRLVISFWIAPLQLVPSPTIRRRCERVRLPEDKSQEAQQKQARLLAAGGVRGQPGGPKPTGGRCAQLSL